MTVRLFLHIITFSLLCFGNNGFANTGKQSQLAIGLFVSAHSSVLTYAFVSTRDGKIVGSQIVRKEMFMFTALGHWPGYVNPNRENLFEKNDIDSCFLIKNEFDKVVDFYCPIFEELWKVRFAAHPTEYDKFGWSHGKYKPSIKQQEYLYANYGIKNVLSEYIYGENLFKLLRDIRKPEWIVNYKSLAKDPVVQGM